MIVPRIFRPQAIIPALLLLAAPPAVYAQGDAVGTPQHTRTFERLFGISRHIDPERVAEVKALPPGEKLEIDTNGDGKINEVWYIDTAYRHDKEIILVRAVDEDGDYAETGRMDMDSDLYFFDWDANGYIDVVIDYVDDDGDNDLDQMGLFYNKNWRDGKDDMTVWWAMDIGGDNLLWYDVNGTYYQPLCQWRTHFSGDELFYQFRLTADDEKWVNVWEDPFAFYDPDGDLASEVVVRISAVGDQVKNLRYSIDADDNAYGRDLHDYDFSVTALPPEEGLSTEGWHSEVLTIRGVETLPVLSWAKTKEFAQQAKWGKAMLTWDEIGSNTDENPAQDPHERWEGVLNAKSKHGDFEQVGGPPSSPFNKRVEVSASPASPLVLYFDEVDQRFHLLGADYGYMDVDFNLDGEIDAAYTWKDEDGDGKLDVREIDVNGDGTVDIVQRLNPGEETYALEFEVIPGVYKPAIEDAIYGNVMFISAAVPLFESLPEDVTEVMDFFRGPLSDYHPETGIGHRIRNTPVGERFYSTLVRDRLFVHLRRTQGDKPYWKEIEQHYLAGEFAVAGLGLQRVTGASLADVMKPPYVVGDREYSHMIVFSTPEDYIKSESPVLQDQAVTVAVSELKKMDPNFNSDDCVVVSENYWRTWTAVPHQLDNWGDGNEAILSIVTDVTPGTALPLFVCYNREGSNENRYPKLTNAVLDNPAHVAWESDAGAFRFYTGQFDFFGKQVQLLPRDERLIYPLIDVNYHTEQDWGIDALHVGKTSGLGGLTIYHEGRAYPVQSPAGEGDVTFEYKVLGSGPVRAGVEIIASNVFPDMPDKQVILRCFIYAGRAESEVNVHLPEGLEGATVGIGLMNLEEGVNFESPGTLGVWGRQDDAIGQIGLAVTTNQEQVEVKTLEEERHLVCKPDGRQFRYWIRGGWRRGMQYPVSYDHQNWEREIREWAAALHADLAVSVGEKQDTDRQ